MMNLKTYLFNHEKSDLWVNFILTIFLEISDVSQGSNLDLVHIKWFSLHLRLTVTIVNKGQIGVT